MKVINGPSLKQVCRKCMVMVAGGGEDGSRGLRGGGLLEEQIYSECITPLHGLQM